MAKNIFENFNFDEYEALLVTAKEDETHIVHTHWEDGPGGFTFVWQRTTPFAKGKMVSVAVSFCSEKDQFCRKIGTFNALNNFYNKGEVIMLPVGHQNSEVIVNKLRRIFTDATI